jgi:hypothetical protein
LVCGFSVVSHSLRFWFFSSKLSRYSQTQTTAPKIAWTDGARAANALLNAPDSLHQQLETSLRTRLDLFSTAQLSDANADPLEQNKTESSELLTILGELRPFLLAIWLEASPNVLAYTIWWNTTYQGKYECTVRTYALYLMYRW